MNFADFPILNGISKPVILAFECLMWLEKKNKTFIVILLGVTVKNAQLKLD